MSDWIVDIALAALALVVISAVVYSLVFSPKAINRREGKQFGGYERREPERSDRRRNREAPPEGVERRQGPRRE